MSHAESDSHDPTLFLLSEDGVTKKQKKKKLNTLKCAVLEKIPCGGGVALKR